MAIPEHPMKKLAGTSAAKQLMAQVSAHRKPSAAAMKMIDTKTAVAQGTKADVGAAPGDAAHTAGSDYADPGYRADKLKRYPLDTAEHVRAAASYFGMPKNRGKYTFAQQKDIQARINSAKKKLNVGSESYGDVVNRYSNP